MVVAKPTVLLVEDDPGDIELLQIVVKEAGGDADFETAMSGDEAMRRLQRMAASKGGKRPDLVLLDLNLPQVHGHEILSFIRQDPALKDMPVAVLTSSDAASDRERCSSIGCLAYLVKPKDLRGYRDLAKILTRILREGLRR